VNDRHSITKAPQ